MLSIAIIGGGPAALRLVRKIVKRLEPAKIAIFESGERLGVGMPYGSRGALNEHVSNVSSDELPPFEPTLVEWVKQLPEEKLLEFGINREEFHEKEVVPRLLLGDFFESRFKNLIEKASATGFEIEVFYSAKVTDLQLNGSPPHSTVQVTCNGDRHQFDKAVISTGHKWPRNFEGKVEGYFDSPYPPKKIAKRFNNVVAIRGSSLTAVDAIKTLALNNGKFEKIGDELTYEVDKDSPNFRIEMHSKQGLLPCLRVHMDEPYVKKDELISKEEIEANIKENDGFLQLDFLFERAFMEPLKESDPEFFETVKNLTLEEFIDKMMSCRLEKDPFELFENEYRKSIKSIKKEKSVPWKELLTSLSIALNYPAKHMSAEDMLRLEKHLKPLVSTVIAFIPQSSAEVMLAMHKAGKLDLISDGDNGKVEVENGKIVYRWEDETRIYESFIDCIGQKPLEYDEFPFAELKAEGAIASASVKFRDKKVAQSLRADGNERVFKKGDDYFLSVPGLDVSDNFQLVSKDGVASDELFLMAVPFMGGLNPDYSGLDFCENSAELVVEYLEKGNISEAEKVSNRNIEPAANR